MYSGLNNKIIKPAKKRINLIVILGGGMVKDKKTGAWRTTGFYEEGDKFGVDGSRLRVVAGALLFKNTPNPIILASGGKGQFQKVKGAETLAAIIKRELIALGVPTHKIIKEQASSNTYEQLFALGKLAQKNNWSELNLISNHYHLARIKTMLVFAPNLAKLFKSVKINLTSAEDVCLKYDKKKWQKNINRAYRSAAMKNRISLEQAGIRDIKNGKYKF